MPYYYTIQVQGLPWISARRVATFAMIIVFAYAVSSSSASRQQIVATLREAKSISICVVGFLGIVVLSVFTSADPAQSLSQTSEVILNWYVPILALLYAIRSERELLLARVIAVSTLVIGPLGLLEFVYHHRFRSRCHPQAVARVPTADNPSFADFVQSNPFRNGVWRSVSIYMTCLSLGEYGAMVAPLGLFYLAHGRAAAARIFGFAVVIAGLLSIICSGSRGGYLGFIIAGAVFILMWTVRTIRFDKSSLAPALVGLCASIGFAVLIPLIRFWPRLHNIVLGGGAESYSDQGRRDQFYMALPHIYSNPITGHGIGLGADVVGYRTMGGFLTLDSYAVALLVETGVAGFVLFFGMIVLAAWAGVRAYVSSPSRLSALAGCIACCLIAFGFYRFFLAQRENHTLFFALIGCIILVLHLNAQTSSLSKSPSGEHNELLELFVKSR